MRMKMETTVTSSFTTVTTKMSYWTRLTEKCMPYADMPTANHGGRRRNRRRQYSELDRRENHWRREEGELEK